MNDRKLKILECTFAKLTDFMAKNFGKGSYHASAICREIFIHGNTQVQNAEGFTEALPLARSVSEAIDISPGKVTKACSDGEVTKFITTLTDGQKIESVLVPMKNYITLCISSQSGCRMGCSFCETGKIGFKRNLTAEEIVGQLYNAKFVLGHRSIKNIVFMGMGEPLDNTQNVIQAIEVFTDQRCFNLPMKNITLSTAGIPKEMGILGSSLDPAPNLAISLNSAVNSIRSAIMPVNDLYDLNDLKQELIRYPLRKKSVIFFGYVLMNGVNDSYSDAQALVDFIEPFRSRVNIIPCNENSCVGAVRPSPDKIRKFSKWLTERSVFVRIRTSKGSSLMAGCGQLGQQNSTAADT